MAKSRYLVVNTSANSTWLFPDMPAGGDNHVRLRLTGEARWLASSYTYVFSNRGCKVHMNATQLTSTGARSPYLHEKDDNSQ